MPDTILLTGIGGFAAKHIAVALLNAGYAVRGTVRRLDRIAELRDAIQPRLTGEGALARLSFAAADLTEETGWDEAMEGAAAVVHTASPFPLVQPRDPAALIRPAVEGTRRVLAAAAAAGVRRVIVTSSTAAIADHRRPGPFTEDDWASGDLALATPYAVSKTLAERAAWEAAERHGLDLTTINPGLILGPPLDRQFGTSVRLVRRILTGKDPMLPGVGFGVVDVRDVAQMHLAALERPATAGHRILGVAGSLWMADMARLLQQAYPDRRIASRTAPALLLRFIGLFDPSVRSILPQLGRIERFAPTRARDLLGVELRTPQNAVLATAEWLVRNRMV